MASQIDERIRNLRSMICGGDKPPKPGTLARGWWDALGEIADDQEKVTGALSELTAWVNRAIVPSYTDRKPMPVNCAKALEAARVALEKAGSK